MVPVSRESLKERPAIIACVAAVTVNAALLLLMLEAVSTDLV
jgi:hypothetical protein